MKRSYTRHWYTRVERLRMQRGTFTGLASLAIVGLVALTSAQADKGRVFYNVKVFTFASPTASSRVLGLHLYRD
jgi:hypothetical protein